ncbi:MAG: beta-ketoacyl-ACP synthase III [Candidatus Omnitrophota bacterium]|nr:beta-ketoacyl-ACP synthase III [Candidatus Omnitrophota bacterium]
MKIKVGIAGVGCYVPSKRLTNADLAKMVDTSDEWITTRTGIKERRMAAKGQASSDLAIQAAQKALTDAKLSAEKLDLIICATITPDMHFPSVACLLQKKIGAKNAACLDISAACAGFVYAIIIAQQFIANGTYKNALVIGVEILTSITDWTDRNTCVLFGDGAGACILKPVKSGGIISTFLASDGTMADLMMLPAGGSRLPASRETVDKKMHCIKMQGKELFKIAVNSMADAAQKVLEKSGLTCKDVDCLIPHQANIRIILAVAKKIGIPENKIYLNIERYGNMSSASTATALCEAVHEGRIKKGDIVLLDAFGAGLVWGACVIKW